ncbi:MAG: zf-HC2 domain-containing protein [Bryobacterales bacterium]|nr:zf-HC2 domain-containing protein [Bryobacterales bacterium]
MPLGFRQDHIPDQDLILYVDAELSLWRRVGLRKHLDACPQCRARYSEMRAAMTGLSAAILAEDTVDGSAGAERRLRARISEIPPQRALPLQLARITAVLAIALSLVGAALALRTRRAETAGLSMPNRLLTPGASSPVTREMVCSASEDDQSAAITASLAITVFNYYGIRNPESRAYEVDYLITPALGGAKDVRNLWPQPYTRGVWNSRVKDALEDRLRELVCAGGIELEQAQRDIANDWIAAYKKYFQTEAPLPEHRAFVKDRAWE